MRRALISHVFETDPCSTSLSHLEFSLFEALTQSSECLNPQSPISLLEAFA